MATRAHRRIPLTRDRVLRAALRLVDEGGIESLSMRKLGQVLGVEAMSLYNHVANKDDILDGILDLVWGEVALPSADGDWEEALRRCAVSAHDTLIRHTWTAGLSMSVNRVSTARLRYMEALLRTLREAGFSPDATYLAYHTLDSHILGFTLWQLGHAMPGTAPQITTREELARFLAVFLPTIPLGDYPYLLEHAEQHVAEGSHKDESSFDFGLRLILDGLKTMRGAPATCG